MFQDELTGWVAGFNQFKAGGNERQKWLSFFSSMYTKRQRISAPGCGPAPNPFVCVFGGVQPGLLSTFSGDDGLAPRLLYALGPAATDGGLPQGRAPIHDDWAAIIKWAHDTDHGTVAMTDQAWATADRWYRSQTQRVATNSDGLAEVHSKMQGYMFRLALVLNLLDCACGAPGGPVAASQVDRAVTLVEWFTMTAGVAYGLNDASNRMDAEWAQKLEVLRAWMLARPGCTRLTVMKNGPRWARKAKELDAALEALGVRLADKGPADG